MRNFEIHYSINRFQLTDINSVMINVIRDGCFEIFRLHKGDYWKRHRKLLNPTVQNYNILSSFYPKFNKHMRFMTENVLEGKVGKGQFDVYHILEACTLDMVCGK